MFSGVKDKNEKRIFERFSARFPARYKDSRNSFGTDLFLRDASAQGAKISTKERLYLNDNISLEVELSDGNPPMQIKGQVVWAKKSNSKMWDAGLKFHNISLMNMSRLYMLATNAV